MSAGAEREGGCAAAKRARRGICYHHNSTGEKVHILMFATTPEKKEDFERTAQEIAADFYNLESGVTDVRVAHGPLDVAYIITFISDREMQRFIDGPQKAAEAALRPFVVDGAPSMSQGRCLMPQCHTLTTLIRFLQDNVKGCGHAHHNIDRVRSEMLRWYPRPCEYQKYIHWNPSNPKAYTRNLVYTNECFDVILMAWPAGTRSAIHDHDESSCWVALVAGEVVEVQYCLPRLDRQFQSTELRSPSGAVGRCADLRKLGETTLSVDGFGGAYVNNERGIHGVENRTDQPAYTLHVYAPGLRKMRIFKQLECGGTKVTVVKVPPWTSQDGTMITSSYWSDPDADTEGIIDATAWNAPDGVEH